MLDIVIGIIIFIILLVLGCIWFYKLVLIPVNEFVQFKHAALEIHKFLKERLGEDYSQPIDPKNPVIIYWDIFEIAFSKNEEAIESVYNLANEAIACYESLGWIKMLDQSQNQTKELEELLVEVRRIKWSRSR